MLSSVLLRLLRARPHRSLRSTADPLRTKRLRRWSQRQTVQGPATEPAGWRVELQHSLGKRWRSVPLQATQAGETISAPTQTEVTSRVARTAAPRGRRAVGEGVLGGRGRGAAAAPFPVAGCARSPQLQPLSPVAASSILVFFGASILVLPKCPDPKQEVSAMEPSGPGLCCSRSAQCGRACPFAGLGCRRSGATGGVAAWPSPGRRGRPRTLRSRPPSPARAGTGGWNRRASAGAQRRAGGGGKWRRAGGTKWRRDPWGWARAAAEGAGDPRESACWAAGLPA